MYTSSPEFVLISGFARPEAKVTPSVVELSPVATVTVTLVPESEIVLDPLDSNSRTIPAS